MISQPNHDASTLRGLLGAYGRAPSRRRAKPFVRRHDDQGAGRAMPNSRMNPRTRDSLGAGVADLRLVAVLLVAIAARAEIAAFAEGGMAAPAAELRETLGRLDSVVPLLEGYAADLARADAAMLYMSAGAQDIAVARAADIDDPEVQSFAFQELARAEIASGRLSQGADIARRITKDLCLIDVALWLGEERRADLALAVTRSIKDDRLRALSLLEAAAAEKRFGSADLSARIVQEIDSAQLERATEHKFCASRVAIAFGVLGFDQRVADTVDRFEHTEAGAIDRFAKIAGHLAAFGRTDLAVALAKRADTGRRAQVLVAIGRALLRRRAFPEIAELRSDAAMTDEALAIVQSELIHTHIADGHLEQAVAELRAIADARTAASTAAEIALMLVVRERYGEAADVAAYGARKAELVQEASPAIECSALSARSLALSGRIRDAATLIEKTRAALTRSLADVVSDEETTAVECVALAEVALGNRPAAVEVLAAAFEEARRQAEDGSLTGTGEDVWGVAVVRRLIQIGEHERARAFARTSHDYFHVVLATLVEETAATIDAPDPGTIEGEDDPARKARLLAARARGLLRRLGRPQTASWKGFGSGRFAM